MGGEGGAQLSSVNPEIPGTEMIPGTCFCPFVAPCLALPCHPSLPVYVPGGGVGVGDWSGKGFRPTPERSWEKLMNISRDRLLFFFFTSFPGR